MFLFNRPKWYLVTYYYTSEKGTTGYGTAEFKVKRGKFIPEEVKEALRSDCGLKDAIIINVFPFKK